MGIDLKSNSRVKRDRKQKFIELAEKRVNRLLNEIKLISNLANRTNYEYTSQQANKLIRVIDEEIKKMKLKFSQNFKRDKKFKF